MHVQICSFAFVVTLPILTDGLSTTTPSNGVNNQPIQQEQHQQQQLQQQQQQQQQQQEHITFRSPNHQLQRRSFLVTSTALIPTIASAKCTDIDACRDIGDKKIADDLEDNPVTTLPDGTRYKTIKNGYGDETLESRSAKVDLIYSLSRAGGQYMYSQGFGFEKIDIGNGPQSDLGLDSYRITLGKGDLPLGIEESLVGMKKGERRRIELPPNVGLESSNWKPEPQSSFGKNRIIAYQRILKGFGSQPAFPAPTIWDVEVLSFKNK